MLAMKYENQGMICNNTCPVMAFKVLKAFNTAKWLFDILSNMRKHVILSLPYSVFKCAKHMGINGHPKAVLTHWDTI